MLLVRRILSCNTLGILTGSALQELGRLKLRLLCGAFSSLPLQTSTVVFKTYAMLIVLQVLFSQNSGHIGWGLLCRTQGLLVRAILPILYLLPF